MGKIFYTPADRWRSHVLMHGIKQEQRRIAYISAISRAPIKNKYASIGYAPKREQSGFASKLSKILGIKETPPKKNSMSPVSTFVFKPQKDNVFTRIKERAAERIEDFKNDLNHLFYGD